MKTTEASSIPGEIVAQHSRFYISEKAFCLVLFAGYLLVLLPLLFDHVIWRDEAQAWLIARDSASLADVFHQLHYEGHPSLYYILLWLLAQITDSPLALYGLNLACISASVALLLFKGPFSRIEKLLLPFGYFLLYEYGVKARSYSLGVALLFLACMLWPRRKEAPLRLGLCLALLANVHIYCLFFAWAIAAAFAFESLRDRYRTGTFHPSLGRHIGAGLIVLLGSVLALITLWPAPDSGFAPHWFLRFDVLRLRTFVSGIPFIYGLTIPVHFIWMLGAIPFAVVVLRAFYRPVAGLVFCLATTAICAFFYLRYPGQIWHHGLIAMGLIAAAWLDRTTGQNTGATHEALVPRWVLLSVLLIQCGTSAIAVVVTTRHAQSCSKTTADYLMGKGWVNQPIVAYPVAPSTGVTAYTRVKAVYLPQGQRWGSFAGFSLAANERLSIANVLSQAASMGQVVTLLTPAQLSPADLQGSGFIPVARTYGSSDSIENFYIYRRDLTGQTTLPESKIEEIRCSGMFSTANTNGD